METSNLTTTEAVELQGRVRTALAQLPADQRQIIELTLWAGLTQRALAAQLRCSEAEIAYQAHLALQTLKQAIDDATPSYADS